MDPSETNIHGSDSVQRVKPAPAPRPDTTGPQKREDSPRLSHSLNQHPRSVQLAELRLTRR